MGDINIYLDCMTRLHCQHLKTDIDYYIDSKLGYGRKIGLEVEK